jgi:hypothetical protein
VAEIAAFRFFTGDDFFKTLQVGVDVRKMPSILSLVLN